MKNEKRPQKMSTIDVVEVVRCRDCKYYERIPNRGGPMCTEFLGLTIPDSDDFCSYGERKEYGNKVD